MSSFVIFKEILMCRKILVKVQRAKHETFVHLAFDKPARLGPDGFESLLVSLDENSQEVRG